MTKEVFKTSNPLEIIDELVSLFVDDKAVVARDEVDTEARTRVIEIVSGKYPVKCRLTIEYGANDRENNVPIDAEMTCQYEE